jgi:uncharacterized protein (TIGR02284 family)
MNDTASVLNDLIEVLKDAQEGFRSASENAPSSELKTVFSEYSLQRSKFAGELQSLARSFGEKEPTSTGSLAGALHRGWIDLKSALAKQDAHALLTECERGEDFAVEEYRKAVQNTDLPKNARDTLDTQLAAVEAAHNRIRALRDSLAPR